MQDFFNKADDNEEVPTGIKIGEVEYSEEDLKGLIADGTYKRELEEKLNTKIDKVVPEYTRLTQEKKSWEEQKAAFEKQKEENDRLNQPAPEYDEATIAKAREEAKKLGLFTKDDVEEYVKAEFPNFYSKQRSGEKLLDQVQALETEINGTDGRPKFEIEEVLAHMRETGIIDPKKAYKDKYEEQLDKWKENQIKGARPAGLLSDSSSSAGGKQPPEVRPNRDNLRKLFREALYENQG